MSKLFKLFAVAVLIAGALAVMPGRAEARWHHRHWGGGWGWAPAFGWGGYPFYPYPYYASPYYYAGPSCGYARVRIWRHHRWHLRRVWRCW